MDKDFKSKVLEYYLNHERESQQSVANTFGISKTTVVRILKENGYAPRKRRNIENEKDIVIEFYRSKPMSVSAVADHFGFCVPVVTSLFEKYGVSRWTKEDLCRFDLDVDYFQLQESDKYIIEKLKVATKAPRELCLDVRDGSYSLTITNNTFCKRLKDKGLVQYKENRISIPSIREDLMHHFVRGFFDGDGCLYVRHDGTHRGVFTLCGNMLFLEAISRLLEKAGISKKPVLFEGGTHVLHWGAYSDIVDLYTYLYKNSTIFLTRKKVKFDNFI